MERLVPADAAGFLRVSLRPSGAQRDAIDALLSRLPEESRRKVGDEIGDLLDQVLEQVGLDWEKDVKPWVGAEALIAAIDGGKDVRPVGVIAVRDEAAARQALDAALRKVGSFVVSEGVAFVAASEEDIASFRAASARGPSIVGTQEYRRGVVEVGGDLLAFGYVDVAKATEGTAADGFALPEESGVSVFGLRAESDALVLEMAGETPEAFKQGRLRLLESTPAGLLAAFAFFDPATAFTKALAGAGKAGDSPRASARAAVAQIGLDLDKDVLPWLHGEISIVVGSFSLPLPEIAVLIESTDDRAAGRTLDAIRTRADKLGLSASGTGDDFTLGAFGFGAVVRRSPGIVVFASSERYANAILAADADTLRDDAIYRRAVGDDEATSVTFVRLDRVRAVLATLLSRKARKTFEEDIDPLLEPFVAIGARQWIDDGRARARLQLLAR